jgi:hypothetical protein
MTKVA